MRVLMLSWEYPPKSVGGLARHVDDLSRELAAQKEEIYLLTCAAENAPREESVNDVRVYRVDSLGLPAKDFITWILQLNFALLEKGVELVERYGPFDIIHAHDWLVAFAARSLKHIFQLPMVSTIHATEFGRNQGLHNNLQRYISDVEWWLTYESWKVIVCSRYMKTEMQNIFHLPDDKISIIPNGVDVTNFAGVSPNFSRRNYAADEEKIVFFVGRLVPEKGVQYLLDAAPKILHYCPEAKFIIAGTGPSEEYLRSKTHMINISSKIYFTGYIDDGIRNGLYKSAQAAVFPSTYEPFGIVALEAMAAGTPVVVADVGGLSDIINHGVDGLKFYAGNPNSLADNVIHLLKNPLSADIMRKKALENVRNYYSWDKIAVQTKELYSSVRNEFHLSGWDQGHQQSKHNYVGRYNWWQSL